MNRLKLLREEKGLSQTEVGKIIGLTPQGLGLYENEKRDIPTEYLIKLAEYFDVSTDYLLGKSDIRNPEEIKFANAGGIDTEGLSEEEINEIQRQVEFMRWKKKDTKDENK